MIINEQQKPRTHQEDEEMRTYMSFTEEQHRYIAKQQEQQRNRMWLWALAAVAVLSIFLSANGYFPHDY